MLKQIDLQTIAIEKVIVHDLPKHKKDDLTIGPSYSEQESSLSDGLRLFFKEKVVQALASDKAFRILYDPENVSPIPWLVPDVLKTKCKDIVTSSKAIAKRLFEIQVGNNASGILVIMYGSINDKPTCIILKLERDSGAQLKLNPDTRSFNIEEVKDLMLTQKTKIYKVALFISRENFKIKFDGMIMDYQIDVKAKMEVITFFIDKFLGCKPFEDPKITTQKFYNYTRSYIFTMEDDINKAKCLQDLNSYIQKNAHYINPREFADDYLKTKEKNEYQAFLKEKHFPFSQSPKDTHLIDNKIKRFVIAFENDVSIISKNGVLGDKVKMNTLSNGQTKAVITSRIKKMS